MYARDDLAHVVLSKIINVMIVIKVSPENLIPDLGG